jgi:hypothetical protein
MNLVSSQSEMDAATPEQKVNSTPRVLQPEMNRPSIEIVCAASIKAEPVTWLWGGWLARRKFHILGGPPGAGKTTITTGMTATITRSAKWPDATRAPLGSALIISYEDDAADSIVPKLIGSGADLARVHILRGARDEKGRRREFKAERDLPLLLEAAERMRDLSLVVIDPIISALGSVDSHKNLETRQALQPLADLAALADAAVIGVAHLTKGSAGRDPLERLNGSIAFGALARIVLGAARVVAEDGSERRVFCRLKSNIGPDRGGYVYDLVPTTIADGIEPRVLAWGEALDGAARDLLATSETQDLAERTEVAEAQAFLRSLLNDGPMSSKAVYAEARAAGHSERTLRRAQKTLRIEATKDGMRSPWHWRLPLLDAKAAGSS